MMRTLNTSVLKNVNTIVLERLFSSTDNRVMELKERVLAARNYAGLSQEELALRVGCTQDMISKLETGMRKKTSHIVKIANACGVRMEWLDSELGEMVEEGFYFHDPNLVESFKAMQQMQPYLQEIAFREINLAVAKVLEIQKKVTENEK